MAPPQKYIQRSCLELVSLARLKRPFVFSPPKFGTGGVVSLRCSRDSGLVSSNRVLCLRVEVRNTWLFVSELNYMTPRSKILVDISLRLAGHLTLLASVASLRV